MMKRLGKLKFFITIAIVILFVYFVVIYPMYAFKKSEKVMENAAKRYYEVNSSQLPTGERIKTLTLQDLFSGSYIKEDIYIPYTDTPCDLKESWVKTKQVDGEYKHYVYLKCGVLNSMVDHKGPVIKLNGEEKMVVSKGSKFSDPGVASVTDQNDGNISASNVVTRGKVDTSKTGIYEIEYSVSDKLKNKSTKIRTVEVKEVFKDTVKQVMKKEGFQGEDPDNYVRLSNMMFRIVGFEGENIRAVAEGDVANVNYDGIDKWLDYYISNFQPKSKKLLVKTKFCNEKLTDTTLDTTKCSSGSTTEERYAYIPSVADVNNALGGFMRPITMSWVANPKTDKTAYLTKDVFYQELAGKTFIEVDKTDNYGVRPMITIKGTAEVVSGDGTRDDPYTFGDTTPANGGDYLNTRQTGEYFIYSDMNWRIIKTEKDGTTKAIATSTLIEDDYEYMVAYTSNKMIYNPEEKGNIGYQIENRATKYFTTKYLVNHTIEVPIYKGNILYGKEVETKKYKVKISEPNTYEIFSAYDGVDSLGSYWMINSSKKSFEAAGVFYYGSAVNGEITPNSGFGVRPVGYFHKNTLVTSGTGTVSDPYVIKK